MAPDSSRIAYRNDLHGNLICIVDVMSGGIVWVSNGKQPAWLPDGQRFAFASDRDGDWEPCTTTVPQPQTTDGGAPNETGLEDRLTK